MEELDQLYENIIKTETPNSENWFKLNELISKNNQL